MMVMFSYLVAHLLKICQSLLYRAQLEFWGLPKNAVGTGDLHTHYAAF